VIKKIIASIFLIVKATILNTHGKTDKLTDGFISLNTFKYLTLNVPTCADDLIGLLAALISKNPDATIAVKVTYDRTVRNNMDFTVRPNVALTNIMYKLKGVPDLIDCFYYFLGNISSRPGSEANLANSKDSISICISLLTFPTNIIRLINDSQIFRILSLRKAGVNFISILSAQFFVQTSFRQLFLVTFWLWQKNH